MMHIRRSNKMKHGRKQYYCLLWVMALACLLGGCMGNSSVEQLRSADIAILYTGDVHCAIDEHIGYAGLAAYNKQLIAEGCETILVDSGDAIQGAMMGSYSKGESIIALMNAVGYSAMTVGNHEFDYDGVQQATKLAELADFPFLSLNFTNKETGEQIYEPAIIIERDGVQIAFIGVSTPTTLTSSTPTYFMNEAGELIYDFAADGSGAALWSSVQAQVAEAQEAGADYVIALTHLGIADGIYSSNNLIANTTGIDVVLDGHSHSVLECERVKNKDGQRVLLSATGSRLEHVGLLLIDRNGNLSTGLVSEIEQRDEDITEQIAQFKEEYQEEMSTVIAHLDWDLVVNDPETDMRIVRNAETNLGNLCADAYRAADDGDIALINGGGIRAALFAGDITKEDILAVNPFGNLLCKMEVTGQVVLDALEFGARAVPEENGGFLQVSGLTYEINTEIPSAVVMDDNGMFVAVDGPYRVQNVQVAGEPLELSRKYTVVAINYFLKNFGDGFTMFRSGEGLPLFLR